MIGKVERVLVFTGSPSCRRRTTNAPGVRVPSASVPCYQPAAGHLRHVLRRLVILVTDRRPAICCSDITRRCQIVGEGGGSSRFGVNKLPRLSRLRKVKPSDRGLPKNDPSDSRVTHDRDGRRRLGPANDRCVIRRIGFSDPGGQRRRNPIMCGCIVTIMARHGRSWTSDHAHRRWSEEASGELAPASVGVATSWCRIGCPAGDRFP